MNRQILIPASVCDILQRLQAAGYEAYVVGGCVRDSLRGTTPSDWDVTTSATPEQILAIFKANRTYAVGQKHGTIAVILEGQTVEITTFRTESGYSDRRHPDSVTFVTDITEDLRRRDFTINAMAYNDLRGLVDPFGGMADLQNGILRCVGPAEQRFSEDALRILRGLRFSATLGFQLEQNTAIAIKSERHLLYSVARERVQEELTRLICGKNAFSVLAEYRDVIAVVIPELAETFDLLQQNPHHVHDVYMHILHTLQNTPPDPVLRWAALLHDIGKPPCKTIDDNGVGHFYGHPKIGAEITDGILRNLRFDSETARKVVELVTIHDNPILPTEQSVKRMLNRIGERQTKRLILLKKADTLALAPDFHNRIDELCEVETTLNTVLQQSACYSLKDLCVKGNDITDLGVPTGPLVGKVLQSLLLEVIDGVLENDRDQLLQRAKALLKEGFV